MIGLIFGDTKFPKYILKKIKKKYKYLIIDLTRKKIFKKNKNSYSVSIGQFGKIISILKSRKCKKVIFAGKVAKPNFKSLKLDLKGIIICQKLLRLKIRRCSNFKTNYKNFKTGKIQTLNSNKFTLVVIQRKLYNN